MKDYSAAAPVQISPIEEIIEDARNGRMFILVDQEDRENEGDLVISAQMCTPEAINFMARHGRGLICLALTAARVAKLNLPMMTTNNASRHETAFTVSIEARKGVSTGISAHDRAHTIAVAINPAHGAADLATPGHVFPLRARDGGVLVRAGHTEAAVDISRLAGLDPSGVICEIMNDDGTMARLPDLQVFARRHGLKIGTIADLIAYRRRHDNLVNEVSARAVTSVHGGEWMMRVFADRTQGAEHVVLSKGDIGGPDPVLTRVHLLNPFEDVLGIGGAGPLPAAMRVIAEQGRGVILLIRDLSARMAAPEVETQTLCHYGLGAEILSALGLHDVVLLTNSTVPKLVGLDAYGLRIVGTHGLADL